MLVRPGASLVRETLPPLAILIDIFFSCLGCRGRRRCGTGAWSVTRVVVMLAVLRMGRLWRTDHTSETPISTAPIRPVIVSGI